MGGVEDKKKVLHKVLEVNELSVSGFGLPSSSIQCLSSASLYFWKYPGQVIAPQANSHSDDFNEILIERLCAFFFWCGQLRETSNPPISLLNDATKTLFTPAPTGYTTAAILVTEAAIS